MILVLAALDTDDDYAYAELFRSLWDGSDDLVIIEHDVIPPEGAVAGLRACPKPWCTHPLWLGDHFSVATLGLVKFSRDLQRWLPDLCEQALPRAGSERPRVHWRSVDSAVVRVLEFAGLGPHVHQPPARHLGKSPGSRSGSQAPATSDTPA